MIAVDTNILVHAHREDSPWNERALGAIAGLGGQRWGIPWPCLHEFLAVVTHPKIFNPPTPMEDALTAVETWLDAPLLSVLGELDGYWSILAELLQTSRVAGPRVHEEDSRARDGPPAAVSRALSSCACTWRARYAELFERAWGEPMKSDPAHAAAGVRRPPPQVAAASARAAPEPVDRSATHSLVS